MDWRDEVQVAKHFIEVDQHPQRGCAGLIARPENDLLKEQRDEEHALFVGQMSEIENAMAWLAVDDLVSRSISSGNPSIQVWNVGDARMLFRLKAS